MRSPTTAQVQSVHSGPSDTVKSRHDYTPTAVHKYSFWVVTTSGVLDLIAYSEDMYVSWLVNINELAHAKWEDPVNLLPSSQSTTPAEIRHTSTNHSFDHYNWGNTSSQSNNAHRL